MTGRRALLALACLLAVVAAAAWKVTQPRDAREGARPAAQPGGSSADSALLTPVEETETSRPKESEAPQGSPRALRAAVEPDEAATEEEAAYVTGAVVDERTDEPVPDLPLRLLDKRWDRVELVLTDAKGRFRSAAPWKPGMIEVRIEDPPTTGQRIRRIPHALEPDEEAWTIRMRIGPTYRLRVHAPAELDGEVYWVHLVERNGEAERRWMPTPLRAGDPSWARWWRVYHNPDPAWTPSIEVHAGVGIWKGEAPVTSTVGVHSGVLDVVAQRLGVQINGRVVDATGGPLGGVEVHVLRSDAAAEVVIGDRTDDAGEYAFGGYDPGRFRLVFSTGVHPPQEREIVAVPGENRVPDVAMPPASRTGTIEGVVRPMGDERPFGWIALRSLGEIPVLELEPVFGPVRRGEKESRPFAFSEVPVGDYELVVVPADGFEWEPERMQVTCPSKGIEIVCRNDVATFAPVFHPFDAESGARIEDFEVSFSGPTCWPAEVESLDFGQPCNPRAEGSRFHWMLFADGYQPRYGNQHAFRGPGEERVVEVRMEAGWGGLLLLRDGDALAQVNSDEWNSSHAVALAPGVDGVLARVNHEIVGVSTDGFMELSLDEPPDRIEFEHPEWRPIRSSSVLERLRRDRVVSLWMTRN